MFSIVIAKDYCVSQEKDFDNFDPSAEHWANAVMFSFDGVSFTLAPQLVSILSLIELNYTIDKLINYVI